jgi:hypothetical protein
MQLNFQRHKYPSFEDKITFLLWKNALAFSSAIVVVVKAAVAEFAPAFARDDGVVP